MAETWKPVDLSAEDLLKAKYREETRSALGTLFDANPDPEQRRGLVREKLRIFNKKEGEFSEAVRLATQAGLLENREAFIATAVKALEPIITLRVEEPEMFQDIQQRGRVVDSNFIPLSELLSYELGEDGWMRLHVADKKGVPPLELYGLMRQGLKKLAKFLKEHPEIPGAVGTSWIVADKQGARLLKMLGFTMEGPIQEEMRQAYFAEETRPIAISRISREEVLKRYGTE